VLAGFIVLLSNVRVGFHDLTNIVGTNREGRGNECDRLGGVILAGGSMGEVGA